MNAGHYVIAAYAVGLGLMLGYAARLWIESRQLSRRERAREGRP